MALSNRQRLDSAFGLLAAGLKPFVDGHMQAQMRGGSWVEAWRQASPHPAQTVSLDDPQFLLRVLADAWRGVFEKVLGRNERNLVSELIAARNSWARNERFDYRDTYRVLDSIERLLEAVSAPEAADVQRQIADLQRQKFEEERRKASTQVAAVQVKVDPVLRPWREVVEPHNDVATGAFLQAEFAADLARVRRGEGSAEYRDAQEFFRRTYLTKGLRMLVQQGLAQLAGRGTTPVVDLQTNFGGGKTHSMLALYHLFGGLDATELPDEVRSVLREVGAESLPVARRAVLVGTGNLSPLGSRKDDGTVVQTIWGELAWQLGGREAFALVAEHDANRVSPTSEELRDLFDGYGPCLVLIDEWVAYARQLYVRDDLAAGTFDAQMTFAQALTEAASTAGATLVVVSIPASEGSSDNPDALDVGSEAEVGGIGGRAALTRLRAVIGRKGSAWRSASREEAFEIVRRRLFEPMVDSSAFDARDAVVDAFAELYRKNPNEFPAVCREFGYADRMRRAYPIHPELFDRLYEDWATLPHFQRTRGVLRLMAAVIHALWNSGDRSPVVLPATLPLDDPQVEFELTRHLQAAWKPVIDVDIDGPDSLPIRLDREFPALGRWSATRRVARSVFLGSAPTTDTAHRGVEAPTIRLGCVVPGETIATFGDALAKLSDRASHLYVEHSRYWFSLDRSVTTRARDLAHRYLTSQRDEVHALIVDRLRKVNDRGDFRAVHVAPQAPGDVPDEAEVRLVVLAPDVPHVAKATVSPALTAATDLLDRRGSGPRLYKNLLVFLAADQRRVEELESAAADHLAWRDVVAEINNEQITVDGAQARHARTKLTGSDDAVTLRIAETYQWILLPTQDSPTSPITFDVIRSEGQAALPVRVSRRLVNDAQLNTTFAPVLVRMQLDGHLASLWEGGHVSVRELWDCLARYVYLPRLSSIDVLLKAVEQGPALLTWETEGFGTADVFDAEARGYLGLAAGNQPVSQATPATLVVRPDVARSARTQEEHPVQPQVPGGKTSQEPGEHEGDTPPKAARRFHGAITIDASRPLPEFKKVAEEVLEHLASQLGTKVTVTVDVEAQNADGYPDRIVRIVTENAATLRFSTFGFEES